MSVLKTNLNIKNGSVLKTFQILDCFTLEHPNKRISEICEQTLMNRSTVFRFINSLNELGILERNKDGSYKLGIKLFELGIKVDVNRSLANKAQPFLQELASSVKESAHMAIRDKLELLYVLKEESSNSIRIDSEVGLKRPMYCTGLGKAILSFMDADYLKLFYNYQKLVKKTKSTFSDKIKLQDELYQIRKSFISIDDEEYSDHVYCVATPIFDSNSKPVAAISVSGLKNRMQNKKDLLIKKVLETGQLITIEIGGEHPMNNKNLNIGVRNVI